MIEKAGTEQVPAFFGCAREPFSLPLPYKIEGQKPLEQTSGTGGTYNMSREELERCIEAWGKDLYSFCCQLTKGRQEADDLYQDTFLKMVELENRLDVKSNPKGYLLSVAVNLWKNRRRKYAWRLRITGPVVSVEDAATELPDREPSAEERMISREEKELVQGAVRDLPDKYRLPVLLFYMEEIKISGIAKILGIPEGTVKSRLYKAKKLLKKELEVVLNEKRS